MVKIVIPNSKFSMSTNSLIHAIDHGHMRKARQLLKEQPELVGTPTHIGSRPTVLFYLYDAKRLALLPDLLAAGADLEAKNADGQTPLMAWLIRQPGDEQSEEISQALIKAGADVNAHTAQGVCVLQCALLGKASLKMLNFILEQGASPHPQVPGKWGPLMRAVSNNIDGCHQLALLQAGARPDEPDVFGRTPLSWAASHSKSGNVTKDFPELHAFIEERALDETLKAPLAARTTGLRL